MPKREFLQLAQNFAFGKHAVGGYYYSEKLDGIRAYWDAGITRGIPCRDVPWANVEKHDRFVEQKIATGLWTRYGQPIHAPDWFLDKIPRMPLDGELTMGRGTWQQLSSCIKQHNPDERWEQVQYAVFDSPHFDVVFSDGLIKNPPNFTKKIVHSAIKPFIIDRIGTAEYGIDGPFYKVYARLDVFDEHGVCYRLPQSILPLGFTAAEEVIRKECDRIIELGGEGLILRSGVSLWKPERHVGLLKVKPLEDAEGTVIGYKFGKPTDLAKSRTGDRTDKLLGLMGSMRVRMDSGVEFDLPGFTDEERILTGLQGGTDANPHETAFSYGVSHPGEDAPSWIEHPIYKRGSRVTFQYRELSNDGKPKESRFWRQRID